MYKFFQFNTISALLIALFLSSCKGKNENFEIDFSDIKIPNKSSVEISNPEVSDSEKGGNRIIKNELINYQNKDKVLSSVLLGKKDPFSKAKIKENNFTSNFKLKGFFNTKNNKYVLVRYLGEEGTLTEESIGGVNTNLLPDGAKVISLEPKKSKLIINFDNKNYIIEL